MSKEYLKQEFVLDFADLLMRYGIKPSEAVKLSEKFFEKNKKKFKEIL